MGKVQKAIEEITYRSKKFPEEAFRVITANKEEAVPYLREAVDDAISKGMELDEDKQLYFYALYLLGEFQDRASFSKIMELVSQPEDTVEYMFGDCLTENLGDILYNTYDGNIALLKESVQNRDIDEFVRSAMLDVMGQLYLDEITMGKYDSYVDAMFEYREDEEGFFKTSFNAADTLRHWAMFSESEDDRDGKRDFDKMIHALEREWNQPVRTKKTGRNDPCPCGSGRKYKHCCLNKPKEAIDLIESPEERSKWLKRYPYTGAERIDGRIYLADYFDEVSIETDKILYLALMNRSGFIWDRDIESEEKRTKEYLYLAFQRCIERMEKEQISSFAEYDEKYSIHYRCEEWTGERHDRI